MSIALPPPPNINHHKLTTDTNTMTREYALWFELVYNVLTQAQIAAPGEAQYLLNVANALLPNAQVLANLPSGIVRVQTGSGLLSSEAMIGSDEMEPTGVAANSYGSSTQVPAYTVDSAGRITAATNVLISGVSPAGVAGGDLSGTYPSPAVAKINGATLGSTTATSGNVLIASGTAWITRTIGGDGTVSSTGSLIVTKTNGVNFAASATTDTTNAANISSGILPSARLPRNIPIDFVSYSYYGGF